MKQRRKLVEKFSISPNESQILFRNDDKKLFENADNTVSVSANTENFSCYAIIKDIPVTRYTLNLNNRIYGRDLWTKVRESKVAERSWCHANHSDDDGDVTKYMGVWHNFRVEPDVGLCDLYVLDNEYGRTLVKGLLAGGKVHFSTFGYGDMMYDEYGNETQYVDPDCYELVRMGDWVAVSSQNVFATAENNNVVEYSSNNEDKEKIKENLEKKDTNISILDEKKEVQTMDNKLSETATISFVKNAVKTSLREAKNLAEKGEYNKALGILSEVEIPEGEQFTDLKGKLESSLNEINAQQAKALSEATESVQSIKDKYELANQAIEELKKKNESLTKMVEQMATSTEEEKADTVRIDQAVEELAQNVEELKDTIEDKDEQIMELESQVAEADSDASDVIAAAEEQIQELADQLAVVTAESESIMEKYTKLKKQIKEAEDSDSKDDEEDDDMDDEEEEDSESKDEKKENKNSKTKKTEEMEYGMGYPEGEIEDDTDVDMIVDAEDLQDYIDMVIETQPELAEKRDYLLKSKSIKAVKRKIQNVTTFKESKGLKSEGQYSWMKNQKTVYSALDNVR